MEPENIRFGGGSQVTILHPLVAIAMAVAVLSIFLLRRKYAIVPAFLALFLIPKGQQIVAAGIHLNVYRIIILAGLFRWIGSSKPVRGLTGGFNFMDRVCTTFFLGLFCTNCLLYMQTQAVIKDAGDLLDSLGAYFLIRFLIRDRDDVIRAIRMLIAVALVNAACMLNEQRTGANIFALLGGMPTETVRDGKIRSQGSFEVFITAGTYGATLVPLLVWLWSQSRQKLVSVLGFAGATIMTITCYASTTMMSYAAGVGAICLWPFRKSMRLARWAIVFALILLQCVMHGPVWSIIEHIDLTGSSSSYHRYMLIDTFIRHFSDWWLIGTKDNGSWGFDMWDASNQFVAYGFAGGLLAFLLFVTIISRAFGRIGTKRKAVEGDRKEEWFLWCLGAAVFAHLVAFFGINYMDQMQFSWLALLSMISVAVSEGDESLAPKIQEALPSEYQLEPIR